MLRAIAPRDITAITDALSSTPTTAVHVHQAMRIADRVLAMSRGEIILDRDPKELEGGYADLQLAYLTGLSPKAEPAGHPT